MCVADGSVLDAVDIPVKIGVTTGAVFAGMVGSETRCEFALVGDVVNLAARLMVAALKMKKVTTNDPEKRGRKTL